MTDLAPPIADFLLRAKRYAQAADLGIGTVSRKIFNDGKTIQRLEDGGDVGVNTLASATRRLAQLERALDPSDSNRRAAQ